MCGRYSLFMDEEIKELHEIIQKAQTRAKGTPIKTGEIFPTNLAPILLFESGKIDADALFWAFLLSIKKAVSSTQGQKPLWKNPCFKKACWKDAV